MMLKGYFNFLLLAVLGLILIDAGCELPFLALNPLNNWLTQHSEAGSILIVFLLFGLGLFVCVGLFTLIRRSLPAFAKKIFMAYGVYLWACYAMGFHFFEPQELRRWTVEGLFCPLVFFLMIWRMKPEAKPIQAVIHAHGRQKVEVQNRSVLERVMDNEAKADEKVSKHEKQHWLLVGMAILFLVIPEACIHFLNQPFWLGRTLAAVSAHLSMMALGLWWVFNPLDLMVDRGKSATLDRLEEVYRLSYTTVQRIVRSLAVIVFVFYVWIGWPLFEDFAGLVTQRETTRDVKAQVSSSWGGTYTRMFYWHVLFQGDTERQYEIYYPAGVPREGDHYDFQILPQSGLIVGFEPEAAGNGADH